MPPGWFVHLDAAPDAQGALRPQPGQVIVVTYATRPQQVPEQQAAEGAVSTPSAQQPADGTQDGQDSSPLSGSANAPDSDDAASDGTVNDDAQTTCTADCPRIVNCAVFTPLFQPERLILSISGRVDRETGS